MRSSTSKRATYKNELLSDLTDPEYRRAFVESHISNGIPFQIRTMRKSRNLNQGDLAKLAEMKQEAICRLENPNYGNFTLRTLKAIAAAFDVALVVRFAPFSELVEWDAKLSSDSLDVKSYDQDSFCQWMKEGDSAATSCEQNVPAPGASENDVFREEYWSEKSSLSFTERIPAAMAG